METVELKRRQARISVELAKSLNAWAKTNNLPFQSADELRLTEGLSENQIEFLDNFIDAWEGVEQIERFTRFLEVENGVKNTLCNKK